LLLAFIVMGAVEDEGTFWIQLLMVVMMVAGVGIYGLVKARAKNVARQTHDKTIETIIAPAKPQATAHAFPQKPAAGGIKPHQRDLSGGMELLARNFLVSVVELPDSPDRRDIEMRRLCFTELIRRGELWAISSISLKVYTLDEDGFYGKIIRCEAMAELAGRTRPDGGAAENSETTDEPGRSRTAEKPQNTTEIPPALPQNQEHAPSAARQTG
jgi:hypothetical protein